MNGMKAAAAVWGWGRGRWSSCGVLREARPFGRMAPTRAHQLNTPDHPTSGLSCVLCLGGTYPRMTHTCVGSPFQGLSEHTIHDPHLSATEKRLSAEHWLHVFKVVAVFFWGSVGHLLGSVCRKLTWHTVGDEEGARVTMNATDTTCPVNRSADGALCPSAGPARPVPWAAGGRRAPRRSPRPRPGPSGRRPRAGGAHQTRRSGSSGPPDRSPTTPPHRRGRPSHPLGGRTDASAHGAALSAGAPASGSPPRSPAVLPGQAARVCTAPVRSLGSVGGRTPMGRSSAMVHPAETRP